MSERLTAEKARALAADQDPSTAVAAILLGIESAAREGKYEYTTREHGFGSSAYYSSPQQWPKSGKNIISELRSLGFDVDVKAVERQFVDIWLQVSWEGAKNGE